ncbi:hypothetical protein KAZ66_06145, partial [Candidatus Woesebacteria bacterium]|nr:hypothetical protein [Candidatus Woesebacteria bacterium]
MKTTKKTDVYEAIKQFQQDTLGNKPPVEQMVYEVRLMNFKIRPVTGNISIVNFRNTDLIDALWSLGKLDEFYRQEVKNIAVKDQEAFMRLVNEMRWNYQDQLNRVRM